MVTLVVTSAVFRAFAFSNLRCKQGTAHWSTRRERSFGGPFPWPDLPILFRCGGSPGSRSEFDGAIFSGQRPSRQASCRLGDRGARRRICSLEEALYRGAFTPGRSPRSIVRRPSQIEAANGAPVRHYRRPCRRLADQRRQEHGVAEIAALMALALGTRVLIVTPLRALSAQTGPIVSKNLFDARVHPFPRSMARAAWPLETRMRCVRKT